MCAMLQVLHCCCNVLPMVGQCWDGVAQPDKARDDPASERPACLLFARGVGGARLVLKVGATGYQRDGV